jgi:hypothetical protein
LTLADHPMRADDGCRSSKSEGRERSVLTRFSRVDWAYEIVYMIAVLGTAALALSLAARRPGWPVGQTPQDPLLVQIYAAHLRHGDLFPVWSSSDAFGMGTPVPLFYQRAFFTVGGLVFIILGNSLKATLIVTLTIFMVIGAYGMRKALGVVTGSRLLRSAGSIGFLLTNWAFSEWLLRGELAEFSAFMVAPWLLYWCLALVKERRLSWSIVPTMVVLVWAHNTIALESIIVLAVTAVTFVICYGLSGLRSIAKRLVISLVLVTAILAPGLVAEVEMGKYYDPAKTIILENEFISSFTFAHPWSFLLNPSFHWLSRSNNAPFGLNMQLDVAITFLLAAGLLTLLAFWIRKAIRGSASAQPRVNRAVVAVLIVSLAIYQLMQFRISLPVWDAFWQLKVLGYPFRMMTFSVPLAFILAIVVADWYLRAYRRRRPNGPSWLPAALATTWLVTFLLLSPVTAHEPPPVASFLPYTPFEPIDALTPQSQATFQTSSEGPLFAEYLPKVEEATGQGSPFVATLYHFLHEHHSESTSLTSVPCSVLETSGTAFESLRITYQVKCKGPTWLALPISYNPFTKIDEEVSRVASRPVAVHHVRTDPRIVIRVRSAGTHTLVVQLPTLTSILF